MANLVIPLFSMRRFTFDALQTSTLINLVIVRAIPCVGHRELTLLLRVHSATIGTSAAIALIAYEVNQAEDEPGVDFVPTSSLCSASVTTSTAPTLIDASASAAFGSSVRIVLQGKRGSSGSCLADLSADLVLKE